MKKCIISMLSVTSFVLLSQPASALFVNGGFETGTTTGWTVEKGHTTSSNAVNWASSGWGTGSGRADVIDSSGAMAGQSLDVDPYNGNYMVRINDIRGGYDATKISQTDAIDQQDIDDGATLYVNWGAMLIEPSNTHPNGQQPFFSINLLVNGSTVNSFQADATAHSTDPSWVNAGYDGGNLWYKHDTWSFDLSTYSLGDTVTLEMYVSDCNWSGHGGYAFLDGIGTTYQPPNDVPEPSTVLLMGMGIVGLLGCSRKRFSKKGR